MTREAGRRGGPGLGRWMEVFPVCGFEGIYVPFNKAQWLSWLERRPVTAEVESSSLFWVVIWDLSSAGRASALQAEGHRFEPYRSHFAVDKYCKVLFIGLQNVMWCYAPMHTALKGWHRKCRSGGTGRRTGLKILRDLYSRTGSIPVCGIVKPTCLRRFFVFV